jgi:1,4-alpha-glucan branching enzyme
MRRLLLESAHCWLEGFHFDALRLDAMHAIVDPSSEHVLHKLSRQISELSPKRYLFVEDKRNEPSVIQDLGFGAVWADDFRHAVRVTMTEEQDGYFAAYPPSVLTVAVTINHGWCTADKIILLNPYRGVSQPIHSKQNRSTAYKIMIRLEIEHWVIVLILWLVQMRIGRSRPSFFSCP